MVDETGPSMSSYLRSIANGDIDINTQMIVEQKAVGMAIIIGVIDLCVF